MKLARSIIYRCFILIFMLLLTFIAFDMSQPALSSEYQSVTVDIIEDMPKPEDLPTKDYSFTYNIALPMAVYLASISGFIYLLLEDFNKLKLFSKYNSLTKLAWSIWILILIIATIAPIIFGLQLLMKSFDLAFAATVIYVVFLGILFSLTTRRMRKQKP
jgi:hypothetical protein